MYVLSYFSVSLVTAFILKNFHFVNCFQGKPFSKNRCQFNQTNGFDSWVNAWWLYLYVEDTRWQPSCITTQDPHSFMIAPHRAYGQKQNAEKWRFKLLWHHMGRCTKKCRRQSNRSLFLHKVFHLSLCYQLDIILSSWQLSPRTTDIFPINTSANSSCLLISNLRIIIYLNVLRTVHFCY
jgi:hypothetical protein